MKNYSGQLIDNFLDVASDDFSRVAQSSNNEEVLLHDVNDILWARLNRDDIIMESKKIYDWEIGSYIEVNKEKIINLLGKLLPISAKTLSLKDDFFRVGILFEFRIPQWKDLSNEQFGKFIYENFINFDVEGEKNEAAVRLVHKLQVSGGGVVRDYKDFRNVIVRIEKGKGVDEEGKEKKCLFVSVDVQRIFDPARKVKDIDISEQYNFAKQYLLEKTLPIFKSKGVHIQYE
jgi:hypothetical protein